MTVRKSWDRSSMPQAENSNASRNMSQMHLARSGVITEESGPKFCSMNITQRADAEGGRDQSERKQKFVELLAKVANG